MVSVHFVRVQEICPKKFSPLDYLRSKVAILTGRADRIAAIPENIFRSPEDFATSEEFSDLFHLLSHDAQEKELRRRLDDMEKKFQDVQADGLAALLEGVLDEDHSSLDALERSLGSEHGVSDEDTADDTARLDTEPPDEDALERGQHTIQLVREIGRELMHLSETDREKRLSDAFCVLLENSDKTTSGQALYDALHKADQQTLDAALSRLTSLEREENVIPGVEHSAHETGENEAQAFREAHVEHKTHFLSHSAKEVLWALLTQIPSVPAIVQLAKRGIPKLAGVKKGAKSNSEQLKKILTRTLIIEASMSAVADNVAAYLFGEDVISSFFRETFGDDVFERVPTLTRPVAVIAKMIAEQAGNLTKVGNGPNFSQEKLVILKTDSNAQGISIDREKIPMAETLPYNNHFATTANVAFIAIASKILHHAVDTLQAGVATIPKAA